MRDELIAARKTVGFTQEQVAVLVDIDRSFYSHIERGTKTPSLEVALRIANAVNKKVEDIFLPNKVSERHNPQHEVEAS
ncbi:helix-turn-helix domain-containing protein [Heliobacterium undosum]|uniref:Helix-turn-helix domain-containing protein n=1 Tax=Heliomicrobium undosum TaxID=121734 RepID=A0A845L3Y5_9FIRM|nr:helix-turn-helix domain-containing protein [Heliomicrobium undosum]MZP31357.1 helix-turn-helix domain-containing protein [Heliomicrobium undosum]